MTIATIKNPIRIFITACLAITCFSLMNAFIKIVTVEQTVPQAMFFRNFIGLIPVLLLIMHRGDWGLVKTKRPFGHLLRGLLGMTSMVCFFWSFALLPLTDATAIHFAAPLIVTILSVILLKETVGLHRWTAVLLGLGAVLFMIGPVGNANIMGAAVAAAAAITSAFTMMAVRRLGSTESSLTIVLYFTVIATILSGIAMMFAWEPISFENLLWLSAIGIVGGIGQIFLTYSYANAPASYVSPFSYLGIIFAAGFDLAIWGIIPSWQIVLGSFVVISSGLYIVYREAKPNKKRNALRSNIYAVQPTRPSDADKELLAD
jgi:drug/metabolite transporter (DMT)-like permease